MRYSLLGLRISWLKMDTWLNPLQMKVSLRVVHPARESLTYARSESISSLYPVTNGAPYSCTSCRNSRRTGGPVGTAEEKRTPRSDSGQAYQRGTICTWPLGQSRRERHSLCVADLRQQTRSSISAGSKLTLILWASSRMRR